MQPTRTRTLRLLALICLLGVSLTACTSEAEEYIQGKWGIGNAHYWSEWYFDDGYYWFETADTPDPLFERGRYAVVESGDDYILLRLFDQEGGIPSIEEQVLLRIEINREEDSLHIRRGDFYRVSSSSLQALATSRAP
jgi:hypothetical protein